MRINARLTLPPSRSSALAVLAALALAGLSGCGPNTYAAQGATLAVVPQAGDPSQVAVVLTGDAARALRDRLGRDTSSGRVEEVLSLSLKPAAGQPSVPVMARLAWRGDRQAALTPQASLTPGLTYVAVFDGPRLSPSLPRLTADYVVPVDRQPSTARVTAVYPSQRELPANLLKFYVHFSEPMAEGKAFEHARLVDAAGRPVMQAFREVELWDADHLRLTLWVNPGRTKRSLGLSESLGPVLEPGRDYTLEITSGFPDQRGRPLAGGLRRAFRTVPPDREQPRIESWAVAPPPAGTREPLAVRFPEPMDHALAAHVVAVENAGGREVAGSVAVDPPGRRWTFTPAAPWAAGDYRLNVGGELEDLAGNSLYRPFETLSGQGPRPTPNSPEFHRPFRIASGSQAARGAGC